MNILFPRPSEDWKSWASQLIVALQQGFLRVPEPVPGTIVLWKSTIAVPAGYLKCDGTHYPVDKSQALRRLYGESTPGNFQVPNVTAPTGTIAVVKT